MMTPIVNINGTSRDELVSQRLAITNALHDALDKIGRAVPHGRDYIGSLDRIAAIAIFTTPASS